MKLYHFPIVAIIIVMTALFYVLGQSELLGTPDPLIGRKTILLLISSVGVFGLVEWLNRRETR